VWGRVDDHAATNLSSNMMANWVLVAKNALDDPAIKRLLTITGVNVTVAAGLLAAIGDILRLPSPQKLVSYVGLNPRVRQSGLGFA
jgi:transposase